MIASGDYSRYALEYACRTKEEMVSLEGGPKDLQPMTEVWRDAKLVCVITHTQPDIEDTAVPVNQIKAAAMIFHADTLVLVADAYAKTYTETETFIPPEPGDLQREYDADPGVSVLQVVMATEVHLDGGITGRCRRYGYESEDGFHIEWDYVFEDSATSIEGIAVDAARQGFENKAQVTPEVVHLALTEVRTVAQVYANEFSALVALPGPEGFEVVEPRDLA